MSRYQNVKKRLGSVTQKGGHVGPTHRHQKLRGILYRVEISLSKRGVIIGSTLFLIFFGVLTRMLLQANIKVQGSNGRNQMLKLWLPGLMQLVGDHVKTEVHKRTDVRYLLDIHSGLRLLSEQ